VALGRLWTLAFASLFGVARAMNLLSAVSTAVAGMATAWVIARETRESTDGAWGAVAGVLCAGLMASVWANATETEVYAIALAHVALMLGCAVRAGDADAERSERWLLCTAYLILLAPAVHLSALVGAPAAIALAARRRDGSWRAERVLLLLGALVIAAGVGRMSLPLISAGVVIAMASLPIYRRHATGSTLRWRAVAGSFGLALVGTSALLMLLVRARHDPTLNQGDPTTFAALMDVVARRQYDVGGLLPRRAPVWWQLANVAQYADWQVALGWGRGIFTSPARVIATVAFVVLGAVGARAMRRDARRLADALLVLLLSGTLGVAVYLNLRVGASLGWGVVPDSLPHEARERDYFFVLGFWAWGCLAGYGGLAIARAKRWPGWTALAIVIVPLAGNWRASDRSREPEASAAQRVAAELLASAPADAVLFLAGDNDSYPLWYDQQVNGTRPDVELVTLPLLSADWYAAEIARRSGLRWTAEERVRGAEWRHEQQAALIARAAREAGRTVAASPLVTAGERALLGGGWSLRGLVYVSSGPRDGQHGVAVVDAATTAPWADRGLKRASVSPFAVDGATGTMLRLLDCPRLALPWAGAAAGHDSLEVSCNFR
jgi:hypothetical protein